MAIAATCNKVQMNDWWVVPRDRWLDVIRARSIGKQLVRSCHTLCNELTSDLTRAAIKCAARCNYFLQLSTSLEAAVTATTTRTRTTSTGAG